MQTAEAELVRLAVGEQTYELAPHWFWDQFANGWELETLEVLRRYLKPDQNYVDIGAWIGPTILYAHAVGCRRIFAVEANPPSFGQLVRNVSLNPELQKSVHVSNCCISDCRGEITFGSEEATSAASIKGGVFRVPAFTLRDYLSLYSISNVSLLKIDIEGSEHRLLGDVEFLAKEFHCPIFLSLHPQFYTDRSELWDFMMEVQQHYSAFDAHEMPVSFDQLREMIFSTEERPRWGTDYGNFFEILLKPLA